MKKKSRKKKRKWENCVTSSDPSFVKFYLVIIVNKALFQLCICGICWQRLCGDCAGTRRVTLQRTTNKGIFQTALFLSWERYLHFQAKRTLLCLATETMRRSFEIEHLFRPKLIIYVECHPTYHDRVYRFRRASNG